MAPNDDANRIYSATYSNVPVFEFNVEGNHVMRRRADDWINATHILKVADFDKPARTRILEREVQKSVHEKVQGGYGKYQGTWVPLHDGRVLAQRNGVLEKLRPIFDYVPGDRSPPQAPKHTTAASNKPKALKAAPIRRAPKPKPVPVHRQMSEDQYENISAQLNDDETPDNSTVASESMMDEDDMLQRSQFSGRKRKRVPDSGEQLSILEQQHVMYADELLDYFILSSSDAPLHNIIPPVPPENFQVDRTIDDQRHTALHWGAAMGDIDVVKDLLHRGADPAARNVRGETPLIRAVLFTNNHEKQTMPKLVHLLSGTITIKDYYGGTIFHHAAWTTSSHAKTKCARYYIDVLLNKLSELSPSQEFANFLNTKDKQGDTALHIVARHNSRKCIRAFQGHGVAGDIYNNSNETAEQIIYKHRSQRAERFPIVSSSPIPPDSHPNGLDLIPPPKRTQTYQTQAARSFSETFHPLISSKSTHLAQTMETELLEKTQALAEARRLLATVESDRLHVRNLINDLLNSEDTDPADEERIDAADAAEYAALERELESLIEQEQHATLHALVRTEEEKARPSASSTNAFGAVDDEEGEGDDFAAKVVAARALAEQQAERARLVREVVQKQAEAGMSERGKDYVKFLVGRRSEKS
ncbi:Transcription regulator HTH, APSES-type DNA-binding domain [Lasallia pustulata]|uniref:Transcription regulator HTH, APSES-type DNA-binding domain n=1 Tax=Lasallia pustulata TaxID=136370 RepID=A0A1W5D0Z7_9LECA|nr:Transcription regulator HTH, APSES-type DNA-binding domain [Lasallia pustulata]